MFAILPFYHLWVLELFTSWLSSCITQIMGLVMETAGVDLGIFLTSAHLDPYQGR